MALNACLPRLRSLGAWAWVLSLLSLGLFSAPVLVHAASLLLGSDTGIWHHHESRYTPPLEPGTEQWEGSPAGVAYSERNHRLAGLFVLLMAVAEFREAFAIQRCAWMRAVPPMALLACGLFLLIWSDHEAWPIGRLTVTETFLGHDHEIIQHKLYGLLLLAVGLIEWLWRTGRLIHRAWVTALPILAIVGGLMLFVHSHGHHPAADKIARDHLTMGVLAIIAGSCRLAGADFWGPSDRAATPRWAVAWASLILLIGVQLVVYSE
jgi:hypothetical protein